MRDVLRREEVRIRSGHFETANLLGKPEKSLTARSCAAETINYDEIIAKTGSIRLGRHCSEAVLAFDQVVIVNCDSPRVVGFDPERHAVIRVNSWVLGSLHIGRRRDSFHLPASGSCNR